MAEIGLGKGAGTASFAAGFGRGLSKALLMNRQRSDEKQQEERARKDRLFGALLPVMLQNMEDPSDLQPFLENQFPEVFTQPKRGAKGESAFDKLGGFLGPLIGMRRKTTIESGWPGGPVTIDTGGHVGMDSPEQGGITGMLGRTPGPFGRQPDALPRSHQPAGVTGGTLDNTPQYGPQQPVADIPPDISQTPAGGAVAPAAPTTPTRRTLFGVPILSDEEQAKRAGRRAGIAEGAKTEAELNAKIAIARRMVETGAASNLGEALDRLGLRQVTTAAGTSYSAARLFEEQLKRREQELGRPLTADEVAKERQTWEALNDRPSNLGIYAEAAARDLGFPSAEAAAQAGQMGAVNKRADEIAASRAGAATGARISEQLKAPLTTKQKFDALMALQDDWRKADNPAREMQRQLQLMETGLKRASADPVGGSQAVLVTFQKILDPTSVVRESEYARSGAGLALLDRLEGLVERYSKGGAGVPLPVLEQMTETARQFLAGMKDWNDIERERISSTAKDAGINPDRVFGVAGAKTTTEQPAPSAPTGAAAGHKYTYDPATGQWK